MKRLLLVEDDPVWANILEGYAKRSEFTVEKAISAAEALAKLDEHRPDVIILDMLLAGETAMVLLNEIRSHDDLVDIPILVCSSLDIQLDQISPFGVQAVLSKTTMIPEDVRLALKRATS